MSFAPYPTYKNSGVQWLGEVPAHWEIVKVRHLCTIKKRPARTIGFDVLSVTQRGIKIKDTESNKGQLSMDYSKYQLVDVGDFVMNQMDLLTGWVGIAEERGVTSPDYRVFSITDPLTTDAKYLLYLFQMGYANEIFFAYGQGSSHLGRWRLPTQEFKDLPFPLPPKDEQRQIALVLDHEMQKTDRLVAEQQRLVELLKEKRRAIVSRAVTKGLDADVSMKPSGLDWAGDIPEHWQDAPVWLLFELGRGRVISHEDMATHAGEYPVYSSQTTNDGVMGFINSYDFDGDYLTWTTDGARAGTVFRRHGRFNCTNVCGTLRPRSEAVSIDFAYHALANATAAFVRHDINPKLMNNVMARIRIPVPPANEQNEIVAFLAAALESDDLLVAESERAIALLSERRSALISAAVTGKIDVRSLARDEAA